MKTHEEINTSKTGGSESLFSISYTQFE